MMKILEHMEYQTIDIPKIKTKVLNIYLVIQCKLTPIFFFFESRFLSFNEWLHLELHLP